ncbi:MAG: hypothetical protein IJ428_03755 [Clostridia bacterium]|nr:hypothetical protein [Clostridia bacterium]
MAESVRFVLDGSLEVQTEMLKEFLGLRPDQSFQDLDVYISDMDDDDE